MKIRELLRLVWLNMTQNKFKVILTSVGIVVGAATIVMVLAIGKGGRLEVAKQFKNLNAGAIDISFEENSSRDKFEGTAMESMGGPQGNQGGKSQDLGRGSGNAAGSQGQMQMPDIGGDLSFGGAKEDGRMNQETVTLSMDDADDLQTFVPGIDQVSISYSAKQEISGGNLEDTASYTTAGVLNNFAGISNLSMAVGEFIAESNEENKEKICILGSTVAKEIFGGIANAYDGVIYIDSRPYVVNGVLNEVGTVASGISPDDSVFLPYSTGLKYVSGTQISPTITVIADDVANIDTVTADIKTVLEESYPNTEFTITDAGSKMEAASESNEILTLLLAAMAAIVFIVGGIGIMNVLFVTVKERTKEIGILKSMGCSQKDILLEFLMEACVISMVGGALGIGMSMAATPIIEHFNIRVELSLAGAVLALGFAVLTGTLFGFYPALKASRLVPVEALSED